MEAVGEGTRADITMTSEVARELAVKTVGCAYDFGDFNRSLSQVS